MPSRVGYKDNTRRIVSQQAISLTGTLLLKRHVHSVIDSIT